MPSLFVLRVVATPVSVLVAVTSASLTTAPVGSEMVPWMPQPAVRWACSVSPPHRTRPQQSMRQTKSEQHGVRRRRESPSGKDPTAVLRYIILLHLNFALDDIGLKCSPKGLAPVTGNVRMLMSRNAKKVFVYGSDCQ